MHIIYIFPYIFYQISPTYFAVLYNILTESFVYFLKTLSFLQSCYRKCVVNYTIYDFCRLTKFFLQNNIWLVLLYLRTLKMFKILICSTLMYVGCEWLLFFYYIWRCDGICSLLFQPCLGQQCEKILRRTRVRFLCRSCILVG
jgi:hypothetical protein